MKSNKTTLQGWLSIVFSVLGLVSIAVNAPRDLTDPTKVAAPVAGITAGVGLIKAKDEDK